MSRESICGAWWNNKIEGSLSLWNHQTPPGRPNLCEKETYLIYITLIQSFSGYFGLLCHLQQNLILIYTMIKNFLGLKKDVSLQFVGANNFELENVKLTHEHIIMKPQNIKYKERKL